MKIQQLFLRNVRNIKELDLDFRDPVTGKPLSRVVLAGANGSGKTTILESVFDLIHAIGLSKIDDSYLQQSMGEARLVFQPPGGLLPPLWTLLFNTSPTLEERRAENYLQWEYFGDNDEFERVEARNLPLLEERDQFFEKASLVYLTSARQLSPTSGGVIAPEEESDWAYRYTPTQQWKGSAESYLVWQNYLDLEDRDKGVKADRFQQVTSIINQILDQKRVAGVERGRVIVEISGQKKHSLNELSSGERQLLLMLVEITRHIKPGGIILIDEPEISLHPAWQRGLMAALDRIIEQYDAQVILATHSAEIASMVMPHEVLFLSDLNVPLGEWKPEREVLA